MKLFIMCGQGFESLLADELIDLGIMKVSPGYCGVHVMSATMNDVYKINYCSRIASRVLLPLVNFRCDGRNSLYQKALSIDWGLFVKKGLGIAIDANVNHPELRNSLFAAQVVKDALCDRLRKEQGFRPSVDTENPDIQINLFIDGDDATISLDTSGQPLHKRGYRLRTGSAPMQETLAAALLRIARYDRDFVMCDPCCGSGTLIIEAALMASSTPPGYFRSRWGFFYHPDYNEKQFMELKKSVDKQIRALAPAHIFGIEREPEIAALARENCQNAGFGEQISIRGANFINFEPSAPLNFLITNPPHGKRLASEEALKPLYRALGDFMKQKLHKPAKGFIFTTSMMLSKEVGLQAKRRHVISSSGLDARLLEFDIYERSLKTNPHLS